MIHKLNPIPRSFLPYLIGLWCFCTLSPAYATPSDTDLSVWANEAIVNAYTFTAENFLVRQKEIAKYLNTEIPRLETMRKIIEKTISLLSEYKTSLIAHAVTGRIKIA